VTYQEDGHDDDDDKKKGWLKL